MKKKATAFFMTLGILLVVVSVLLVSISLIAQNRATRRADEILSTLYTLMPQVQDGIPGDRFDTTMPVTQVDGLDFVGIVELPAYETALPIYGAWERKRITSFPCRYLGSVYDGSLIISGSDNIGQFDFMKSITGGDTVCITDMTGVCYTYEVTDIEKTKDVSTENLTSKDADLILFARSTYARDYTVVECRLKNTV